MRALRPVSGSEFFLVRSSALPQALPIELPTVAVVIPAYRAARTIENVIAGVPSFVRHIVVVDDGSPDETADVVRRARHPRGELAPQETNQGGGAAGIAGEQPAGAPGAELNPKL